jgi:hypothetical protein
VTALELFERSCTLRRMYYAGLAVAALYGVPAILQAVRWW